MTRHRIAHLAHIVAPVGLIVAVVAGCSSGTSTADGGSSAPPSTPGYISLAPTVQKDSIEDVNSTKDMTGVVTTYSGDNNPYFHLIPYVCPFIPDWVVRQLGMTTKRTGFGGQHKLLQTCILQSTPRLGDVNISYAVGIQAVSLKDVLASNDKKVIERDVSLGGNIRGTLYTSDASSSSLRTRRCSVVSGTFYGSVVVSTTRVGDSTTDPCEQLPDVASTILPLLPDRPNQMRPTE